MGKVPGNLLIVMEEVPGEPTDSYICMRNYTSSGPPYTQQKTFPAAVQSPSAWLDHGLACQSQLKIPGEMALGLELH